MENQKKTSSKYAPGVRERAVRTVFDNANQYASKWEAVCSIAAKIGCSAGDAAQVGTASRARS
jgi:hypothetical protein